MKNITREVKIYDYTIANIDLENGTAVNRRTISGPDPLGQRELARVCKDNDNAVVIHSGTHMEKFSMPLSLFTDICRAYAGDVGHMEIIFSPYRSTNPTDNQTD